MLGYISTTDTPGAADLVLQDLAATLADGGVRLAGAVQINTDNQVLRRNRLNLLSRIREAGRLIADFGKIEG